MIMIELLRILVRTTNSAETGVNSKYREDTKYRKETKYREDTFYTENTR